MSLPLPPAQRRATRPWPRIAVGTAATLAAAGLLGVPAVRALVPPSGPADPVVRPVTAGPVSPWSVATSHGSAQSPQQWLPLLASAGVPAVRGFIERGDSARLITGRGLTVSSFLIWSPDPRHVSLPVDDLAGWRAYVGRTVRAHPEVRAWEVWNEPPNFTENRSPAAYAQVVRVAYDAVKAVDPRLEVGLAAKSTQLAFLADALDAGAAGHYDFVSLHPYERVSALFDGWDATFLRIVPDTRAMLAVHDPERRDAPIDFSELGSPAATPGGPDPSRHLTPSDQADVLVKAYTLAIAQGVRRVSWYDIWDGDLSAGEAPYGLLARDGRPRPAFSALRTLIRTLGPLPRFTAVRSIGPPATVLEFATDGGPVLVAWSGDRTSGGTSDGTSGGPETLGFPGGARVSPVTGGRARSVRSVVLSPAPVLVRPGGPAGAGRDGRGQVPAQVEPSGAYQVSWSAASGSAGLLVRGGRPAVVDGRPVRDLSTSVALDLAVLPPAPRWGRSRLQIEARVLALRPDAGFTLRYDAGPDVDGADDAAHVAAGPWRSVPARGWHVLTWNVDSARLVGVFGNNLTLDSDSQLHAGYLVSDVRVTVEPLP